MTVLQTGWTAPFLLGLLLLLGCGSPKEERAIEAYNRGLDHSERSEWGKAIADYDEAIRLNPKLADAYFNRGIAYAEKGEHDKAIADYTEAIRLNPSYAEAYCHRARCYGVKGDFDKALADFRKARELGYLPQ